MKNRYICTYHKAILTFDTSTLSSSSSIISPITRIQFESSVTQVSSVIQQCRTHVTKQLSLKEEVNGNSWHERASFFELLMKFHRAAVSGREDARQ